MGDKKESTDRTISLKDGFFIDKNLAEQVHQIAAIQQDSISHNVLSNLQSKPGEVSYGHLFEKEGMNDEDRLGMQNAIQSLIVNKMLTQENIQLLDDSISYTQEARIVHGVAFSKKYFIPEGISFTDKGTGIGECEEQGIYKIDTGEESEYYLSSEQYKKQTAKQGVQAIEDWHIQQALKGLPGWYKYNKRYLGGNILADILRLPRSGCVSCRKESPNKMAQYAEKHEPTRRKEGGEYGYLGCVSTVRKETQAYRFSNDGGKLGVYRNEYARPHLFIVK